MDESLNSLQNLKMLYEISGLIQSQEKLQDKFYKAMIMIKEALKYDSGSLFIYNKDSDILEEVVTLGKKVDLIETTDFEFGKGLSAWVAKKRDSVLLPDVRKEGFRSFISTPLVSADNLVGVLNLGKEQANYFNESHLQFLEIISSQLAITIERAKFETELINKNNDLEEAHLEIEKQQEKIIELERTQVLAQIAASLNHEINNPLTTVIGNIELLLLKKTGMDDIVEQKLIVIKKESERIRDIVEKFRDIKKVVTKDYLKKYGEKMIDIYSSVELSDKEKLS
jgi:K+-sensing histidine kinase KdpD